MFESGTAMERRSGESGVSMIPTITERLKRQQQELRARLAQIDEAVALIESNPQMQRVIDAISKLTF